ncbi:unnamed protein product [Caenorhabditis brenneri]
MDNSTIDLHGCLIEPAFLTILKEYLVFEDLPAKCLPSTSTSVRPRYPKIEDDGKQFLKQMFDNCPLLSRTRVEMYGSPEELAENLKIYSDFPSNHRVFGFLPGWPYNTTITKYKSLKTEEEFIYKQDLFTYIHHQALKYIESQCFKRCVLVFQTLFLKQFGEFYDDRCEFIKYDQVWMNNLKKKYTKVWKKAQRLVKDPNFKNDNIYTSVTPLFTDMMPNWMKRKEDMHLLPTPVVVRVFNDEFVFEKEFMDAMKLTGNCHSSLVLSSKPLFPVIIPLTSLTGYNIFTDAKNVNFVRVPIKRAKHAATPVLSPYGGHCISSVDAFLEILRVLIFRHRIFQRFKKHQWQTVKTVLSILGQTFTPHMRPHFISVSTIARLKTSLAEQMEPYKDLPFREYRRVDHEGFTLEDLNDELNHSKLDECFPEIGRYARMVYEEVDEKKLKPVLRTCDFYDALEHCQLICFLERMNDLKLFLHQQQGCSRVPQLHCDYCKPPPIVPKRYLKTHVIEYKIDEMTVTYLIDKEEDLTSCILVSDELKREFYSNMKYFSPGQAQDYGAKFFILDSNDVVKRERGIRMISSLRNYVKVHPFKKLYLRAIPTNTFIESRRVFTEEVLEIIQILLKLRTNDARLRHYRKKWPPRKNVTIDSTELRLVLEDFDVDKERITLIPDASHEITVYRMLTEPDPLYLQVSSPIGKQMIMRPYQLIYFLFRRVVCSLNWNKERCKIHEDCLEGFRMIVLGKMREIADFDENAYIPTTILDNILQGYQTLCPFLYSNPPKVTPMSALSVYSYDETISNDRFQTISRLFGLEDFMEPDEEEEEEEKEDIRIDMARYRILEALISQFVRGEANEIEMILTDELWTCNSPRVEGIRKPKGVLTSNEGMIKFDDAIIAIQKKKPKKRLAKTGTDSVGTKNSDEMNPGDGGFVEETDGTSKLDSEDAGPKREELVTVNIPKGNQDTKNDYSETDEIVDIENHVIAENHPENSYQQSLSKESKRSETETNLENVACEPEVEAAQKPEENVEILTDELTNLNVGEENEDQAAENVENATEDIETSIPDEISEKKSPEHQADTGIKESNQSDDELVQKRGFVEETVLDGISKLDSEDAGPKREEHITMKKDQDTKNNGSVVDKIEDMENSDIPGNHAENSIQQSQDKEAEHAETEINLENVACEPEVEAAHKLEENVEMLTDKLINLKVEEENEDQIAENVENETEDIETVISDKMTEECNPEHQAEIEIDGVRQSEDEMAQKSDEDVGVDQDLEMEDGNVNTMVMEIVNDETIEKNEKNVPETEKLDLGTRTERNQHEMMEVSTHLEPQVETPPDTEMTKSKEEETLGIEINHQSENEVSPRPEESVAIEDDIGADVEGIVTSQQLKIVNDQSVEKSDAAPQEQEELDTKTQSERNEPNLEPQVQDETILDIKFTGSDKDEEKAVGMETKDGNQGHTSADVVSDSNELGDLDLDIKKKEESLSENSKENLNAMKIATDKGESGNVETSSISVGALDPEPHLETETGTYSESQAQMGNLKVGSDMEMESERKLSEDIVGGNSCEDQEATENVVVNQEMKNGPIPKNQHLEAEEVLENHRESVEDNKNPAENTQDITKIIFFSQLEKKENVEIEVNEELELSDISDDSWEDPNPMVTEPVDENPEIKDEEIPNNQQVEPEVNLEQTLEGENSSEEILSPMEKEKDVKIKIKEEVAGDSSKDSYVSVLIEIPMNQKVEIDNLEENLSTDGMNPEEDPEQLQKKTLPPLHVEVVEVRNPRASHAEMKDSGCSEASTIPELVTDEFRKLVTWKSVETQTSTEELSGSQSKDKEIEGLKRENLQLAEQSKSQINQLQEKFEATKSQMSQRIKELEEELRMERDKVATPCNNNEVEELKKTIKVLQENNAALTVRDEEKAKMIKMLMDCLKGNSVPAGEAVGNKTAGSSVTEPSVSK